MNWRATSSRRVSQSPWRGRTARTGRTRSAGGWPSGAGRRVVAGLDVDLAEADGRLAARRSASNARWASSSAAGDVDRRAAPASVSPGAAVHSGSALSAALNFTTGLRTFHASRRVAVVGRDVVAVEQAAARRFGSALQTTVRARMSVPSSSRTPSPGTISADRDAAGELRAGLLRGVGDREADHPHAALDVAPHRALALEVALVVHELDRGGARVLRAAVGGDDRPGRTARP